MIDSHAHIQFEVYDEDREAMLKRAWDRGLSRIIVIGGEEKRNDQALSMAKEDERLRAVIGIHPLNAGEYSPDAEEKIKRLLREKEAVAIGEIGLDYHNNIHPKETQWATFASQLELAKVLDKPIVIHSRDAKDDRGQVHCFSYDAESAERFLELGFHISFCGPITFKNGQMQRSASMVVPLDRLLVETDCPYMAPEPNRGKRNEPSYVVEIALAHAKLRNLTYKEIDEAVTANAEKLFML